MLSKQRYYVMQVRRSGDDFINMTETPLGTNREEALRRYREIASFGNWNAYRFIWREDDILEQSKNWKKRDPKRGDLPGNE